jgi:hypothetical protein
MNNLESRINKLEKHVPQPHKGDNWPKARLAKDTLPEQTLIEAAEEAIDLDIHLEWLGGEARNE